MPKLKRARAFREKAKRPDRSRARVLPSPGKRDLPGSRGAHERKSSTQGSEFAKEIR